MSNINEQIKIMGKPKKDLPVGPKCQEEFVFPIWMAIEILCRRYCLELASSVSILRCCPKSDLSWT